MAESLDSYFLFPEGGEASELGFTPSAEVLGRYPIDLSTGLATLQPPQPQGPAISDLERIAYAAPTPPARIDVPPNLNAGLATLQMPQAPAPTPSLASPMSFAAPSAVRVEPTPAPAPTPVPQPKSKPSTSQPTSTGEVYAKIGDPLPGQPGVRVGDPIPPDSEGNQWVWDLTDPGLGYFVPPKPTTPEPPKVEELTPEQVTETVGTQTPTTSTPTVTLGTNTPPPGTEIKEEPDEFTAPRVILEPIKYDPFPISEFQFNEPARTTTSVPTATPGVPVVPTLRPTTIESPMRRAVERLAPGIFRDINYDPELILEAAMRSMGPRYAKQSLIEEQRMFERMK